MRVPGLLYLLMNSNNRLRNFRLVCSVLCLSGLAARAEDTDTMIAKGDQFDKQLQAKEALEVYLPANKLDPDNVKLLVCIARQYRHLMSDTSSQQEKLRLGNVSLEFATRAAALAPKNAEAQLSPAISLGKMLPFMSSKIRSMLRPGSRRRWTGPFSLIRRTTMRGIFSAVGIACLQILAW